MSYKLLVYPLLFVFMLSCKKENMCDCVKSSGKENVIYRDLKDFTCLDTKDKMEFYITQGPAYEVRVEAGENLQKLIKTEIDGETLRVFNTNRCNWVRGYKHSIRVYITAPYFKHIKNGSVGTIQSTNTITQDDISVRIENTGDVKLDLNTQQFFGSVHGNGNIYLTGTTKDLMSNYTGTNYLYASDLTVQSYVYLHSISIGHAYIKAPENGLMDIEIDRDGDVHYTGNPNTIHLTKTGKGELIKD